MYDAPTHPSSRDGLPRVAAARLLELGLIARPLPDPFGVDIEALRNKLPDYELTGVIAVGGMGAVLRARQRRLDRTVAIKIIHPRLSTDPGFEERFEREALSLAHLVHPGIVTVHDYGRVDDVLYIVMEYVDGSSLRQVVRMPPELSRVVVVMQEVCDALQYAHDQGIVHRDIKPENLLVDARGRVRVADFGLAKLRGTAGSGLTATAAAMGTPSYMAPEQFETPGDVDHRADIFSLGVVLYELLTGQLPVGRFALPSELRGVDLAWDDIVLLCLEHDRERRFTSVSELQVAIAQAAMPRGRRRSRSMRRSVHGSGPGSGRGSGRGLGRGFVRGRPSWIVGAAASFGCASLLGFLAWPEIFNEPELADELPTEAGVRALFDEGARVVVGIPGEFVAKAPVFGQGLDAGLAFCGVDLRGRLEHAVVAVHSVEGPMVDAWLFGEFNPELLRRCADMLGEHLDAKVVGDVDGHLGFENEQGSVWLAWTDGVLFVSNRGRGPDFDARMAAGLDPARSVACHSCADDAMWLVAPDSLRVVGAEPSRWAAEVRPTTEGLDLEFSFAFVDDETADLARKNLRLQLQSVDVLEPGMLTQTRLDRVGNTLHASAALATKALVTDSARLWTAWQGPTPSAADVTEARMREQLEEDLNRFSEIMRTMAAAEAIEASLIEKSR